jgi:hypothetical protein
VKRIVVIDARTKMPRAAQVVPIQAHATLSLRALVTPARTNLAGHARVQKVVFAKRVFKKIVLSDHLG